MSERPLPTGDGDEPAAPAPEPSQPAVPESALHALLREVFPHLDPSVVAAVLGLDLDVARRDAEDGEPDGA
jgi:hypothetical protein